MARGGARDGAGRKPGSLTAKTREIAEKIAESGDTPLEALSELRRWAMSKFRTANPAGDFLVAAKAAEVAADWASRAAPYVHAKLAAVTVDANVDATVAVDVDPAAIDRAMDGVNRALGALADAGRGNMPPAVPE